jgi:CubicO group peptidase (beta-lactamase class C family)
MVRDRGWRASRAGTGVVVLCVLCCCAVNGARASGSGAAGALEQLKADLDSTIQTKPIPGAAIAVVSRDSIEWVGTFGLANLETGEPITRDTHFGIGSCTKSFVGLGLLKLADEGRIDLQAPVHEIAPEIAIENPWRETHPVRVIHLLEHTAGFDDAHLDWFYFETPIVPLRRALDIKADLRRVRWPPGTRCSYSSPGFTLAGYILGKVAGQPYEEYLRDSLFLPFGMRTSTIGCTPDDRRLRAVGYDRDMKPFPTWYDYDEPAGAMNASIQEMALFVQFMLNRGVAGTKRILSEETFERIGRPTTTAAARAGLSAGYSFGVGVSYRAGRKWYGHQGAIPGFFAGYEYNPDYGCGYVILLNTFDNVYYDDVFGLVQDYMNTLVLPERPPVTPPIPEETLKGYCGYYELRSSRFQFAEFIDLLTGGVTIRCLSDTLRYEYFMSDPHPLIPVSETLFRRPKDPEATFAFTESPDGEPVLATRGSYYVKADRWRPTAYVILLFGTLIAMGSTLVYGACWIPVYLFKRWRGSRSLPPYTWMRIAPLLAVVSLVTGSVAVGGQNMLELGQITVRNVIFCVATVAFAAFSVMSIYTTYRGFVLPVRRIARLYTVIVSAACLLATAYLAYWGMIGVRVWAL